MRNFTSRLGVAMLLGLLFISAQFFGQTGILQTYVTLDYNGSLKYFEGGDYFFNPKGAESFDGQYLGTFSQSDVFELAGADVHTFRNTVAGDAVSTADLYYTIYKAGGSGSFTSTTLDFCCVSGATNCNAPNASVTCDTGVNTGDEKWTSESIGVDILAGLDPGEYTIEVFFEATTSLGARLDDNSGSNFTANFTIGTDGFMDGDLTSGTVWSGETSSFSIVDPTTDTGTGLNSNINGVGIENNEVLVSNASTADAVITTPSDMAYGTWQFSFATADGFNPSAQNSLKVILMSDENDVSKLKDGVYDFNGYMIEAGQNGATDHIRLYKMEGSSRTTVITTAYPGTASFDLGYRVKVNRARNGDWEIFAEEGFDGTAATTSIGTGNDNEIKTSSYFALTTELIAGTNNRIYYDNVSLSPNTELTLDITSSGVNETDGTLSLNVQLANPSEEFATTADVVLIKGDPSRIGSYSTQSLTFSAGSSASQNITLNITDNDDCDYNTILVLEIQSVTGGINAETGEAKTSTIFLTDDNTSSETNIDDDFEDTNLAGWSGDIASFTNEATTELNGAQAVHTDAIDAGDGNVSISLPNSVKDLAGAATTWRFSFATGMKDPNTSNRFMYYLTSSISDPNDMTRDGYAVGLNGVEGATSQDAGDDIILYKIGNGFASEMINHNIAGGVGSFDSWAIEVTRSENGEWELLVNDEKDFDNLISVGTTTDATYDFMGDMMIVSYKGQENGSDTNWNDWEVWFDDISVTQEFCSGAYETTASGTASSNNWQLVGTVTPVTPPFNKYTDIIVKDGDVLTLDSDVRTGLVTVEAGGELDLGVTNQTLEIANNLVLNGTLTANKGAVSMIGNSGAQTVSGSTTPDFYEFNVDNTLGVSLALDANFYGPIHPENGTLSFGSQNITLASADIGGEILTGSISEIKSGADVTGQITMQRYVESFEDGYRLIGLPVTSQTVGSAFTGDFELTGITGSEWPDLDYTNLKYYDETTHTAGNINIGFKDVISTTDAVDPEKGYWAYFPPETTNYMLDATGDFRKGDITVNLDYTPTGDDANDGWNCIANPYPSAIDIMSTDIIFTNCERTSYILDHTLGSTWKGEYSVFDDGTAVNGGAQYISSYQGFFVKATGPGASVTFRESAKSDVQASFLRLDDISRQIIRLSVNNELNKYETVISFQDLATDEYDSDLDAYFLESNTIDDGALTISSVLENTRLSINTFAELTDQISVPLEVITPLAGEYFLSLDALQNISTSVCLVIEDTENEEFYMIEEGTEIPFQAPSDNYGTDRFILHAYPGAAHSELMTSCNGSTDGEIELIAPNYGQWIISWLDNNGEIIEAQNSDNTSHLTDLSSGLFTVILTDENGYCNTLTEVIEIYEPTLEIPEWNYTATTCDIESGEIRTHIENANQWTVSVFEDNLLVSEITGNSDMIVQDLSGSLYTVQLNSECSSEEFTVDLRDENAVVALMESPSEVILTGGIAPIQIQNISENGLFTEWYLEGELISQSENLTYEFYELGEYEFTLVSSNEVCSSETSQFVLVSTVDNITENELSYSMISTISEVIIQFSEALSGVEVEVFDMNGKLVYVDRTSAVSELRVPKSEIANGIYNLTISSSNEILLKEKFRK